MRRIVVWVCVACLAVLVGCSTSGSESAPTITSGSPAAHEFDLSKLSELEDDMPEGFIPYPSEVKKLQHAYVAAVGTALSTDRPVTVDPPNCAVMLKPVDAVAGSDSIGIRADGKERRSITVGAYTPVEVPTEIPATGCDRMTYQVAEDDRPFSGTAERVDAPSIDGATTFGLKIAVDGFPDPEYFYVAIVDNRLYVNVNARVAPDYAAQPLLPDMLVKAVAAVRNQEREQSGPTSEGSATASPPTAHALSRLAEIGESFPPGLTPGPTSGPTKVSATFAHQIGEAVSFGKPFTVDPSQCRPLFKPVDVQGGADEMVVSAGTSKSPFLSVRAVSPVAVPEVSPSTGCEEMSFAVDGAVPDGIAERLAAPRVDGAITDGLRASYESGDGVHDYFYTAILDDRTFVQVTGRMDKQFHAEQLLPDLLIKAVDLIRA